MKKYDFIIVGSGLYGATMAARAKKAGYHCLVLEKRNHVGGNAHTELAADIQVHKYGAHIFHTSDEAVWDFVNSFAKFNRYTNSPIANYNGEVYNLPFNMNTFNKMWGTVTPQEALQKIETQRKELFVEQPRNLEEQGINLVGKDIYEKLIKGYTEKQWGRPCTELPPFIIRRLPVRFTYDNNYFNDTHQGIPVEGYTAMVRKMLEGTEVLLGTNYLDSPEKWASKCKTLVYTGPIDEFFDYRFGELQYRSLRFETEVLEMENFQGNAVVNYTDSKTPYTRIIEHKHFQFGKQKQTVISREYSKDWQRGDEPYYPINDEENNTLYNKYASLAAQNKDVVFGGRLAEYKYYDMDKVIASALKRSTPEVLAKVLGQS